MEQRQTFWLFTNMEMAYPRFTTHLSAQRGLGDREGELLQGWVDPAGIRERDLSCADDGIDHHHVINHRSRECARGEFKSTRVHIGGETFVNHLVNLCQQTPWLSGDGIGSQQPN